MAKKADCALLKLEGQSICLPPDDLQAMQVAAKEMLALDLVQDEEVALTQSSLNEGIPLLLRGLNIALGRLDFLEHKSFPDKLKNHYINVYIADQEAWIPLWKSQELRLKHDLPQDLVTQAQQNYAEAEKQFLDAMALMGKSDGLKTARQAFLESEKLLNTFLHLIWKDHPIQEIIQNLASLYFQALAQDPIQETTLFNLQITQNQMSSFLEAKQSEQKHEELKNVVQDVKKSTDILALALQSLSKIPQAARIYLEAAYFQIKRILRLWEKKTEDPQTILEEAIEDQKNALSLNRMIEQLPNNNPENPGLDKVLLNFQQAPLTTMHPFLKKVILMQADSFENRKDNFSNCQQKPWDEVFPLVEKGRQLAADAWNLLEKNPIMRDQVMANQEEAVRYWQEALAKLKQKMNEEKQANLKEKQPPPASSQLENALRLLQEMNQQDRRPHLEHAPVKEGLRPW